MRFLLVTSSLVAGTYATFNHFDKNLVFRSPFLNEPQSAVLIFAQFGHDIEALSRRSAEFSRRDTVKASPFKDEPYPGFYSSDFSNAASVWSSGVNFTHSGISLFSRNQGDPLDSSIILWTRAEPLPDSNGQLPPANVPVCVSFKIATSDDFRHPVDTGDVFTTYDVDFTVKVEATRLRADTKYFYQFADCTNAKTVSPTGATRTLSSPNTPAKKVNGGKPLSLAVFSCSDFGAGHFNAYGYAARNVTPDVFVHLGDYMYESAGKGANIGRLVLGRVLATIHDYRGRFSQYRQDPDLQFAHQMYPWIAVWWDDHEIANNAWKAGTSASNDSAAGCTFSPSGACFTDRKMAGTRAYHEWMPIRQVDAGDQLRIWRNFQIGKLLDLTMLDTLVSSLIDDADRSIMGHKQEQCTPYYPRLSDTLSHSKSRGAIWRIVGQQVVFTQDAWDSYRANRNRILDQLYKERIDNAVILSGDSHANWVSDLAPVGVEFAGTGVTSTSGSFVPGTVQSAANVSAGFVGENIDLQWSEGFFRGFFSLDVTPEHLSATYYSMRNVTFRNSDGFVSAKFSVKAGDNHLTRPVADGKVLSGALKNGNH
ncbi:hypothetical protein AGABI2DRAFT_154430 [Agaricus bisporus var. bisporus H97]|uniref:hypothetical protein n=1 Tax=Agaricus bisporus var. bisporus (strain H97 / ATCC MYA-4626 / FGSC 10389) TaxID=936046 RepID=UPI00029F5F5A|nr:hypothetical protein AGABI2DRAFT_154430 [Agaricus bisporus var. bisporus H97]EKV42150.1 hypothetical protein AGABI2DRAFT_154430 [Agaricus bisporus var. bisporus H97]